MVVGGKKTEKTCIYRDRTEPTSLGIRNIRRVAESFCRRFLILQYAQVIC